MRHFFRGGRGMAVGQSDKVLSNRPIKQAPTVYQLSSAQDLPWFYLCSASPRSAYDRAVTRLRSFLGASSQKGRTWLGLGRVLVGTNAGIANAIFRPISTTLRTFFALSPSFHLVGIEWASNWNRVYPMNIRCVWVFDSINYRKRIEDNVSKYIQRPAGVFLMDNRKITVKRERQTQPNLSHALAMPCLYTGYEQETPKNGTRNYQETYKDCTRMKQETPKRETRIRQESRNSTSKNTPERYCRGTGKVLKSGGKGTGEVLESYQRGTKEVPTGSRSVVALEWDRDCFGVVPPSRNDGRVVNDPYMNRLVLKGFSAPYEDFRCEVESMAANGHRGLQIALKEVMGAKVKSKPFAHSLQLIAFIVFCVLFSNPDLLGTSAMAQSPHRAASRNNFGDKVPFVQSPTKVGAVAKVKQEISTKGLVIGDSLPDWFWEQELQVVNHPQKNKTIKLSAYKQQLLVLDFLNTACVPCIKSVDKWNELQPEYRLEVSVLPIHLYGDNDRIAPFAVQRDWEMPIAVGNRADTLINQLFYVRRSFGQVWIKDGRLLAIPQNKDVSRSLIGKALTRRDLGIQMNDMLTYFDRRYYIKEEE